MMNNLSQIENINFKKAKLLCLSFLLLFIFSAYPNEGVAQVNGRNVQAVLTTSGLTYSSDGGKNWTEFASNGTIKTQYKETKRDAWSVYLTDKRNSRNRLAIDLYKKKVKLNGKAIHTIKGSSVRPKAPQKENDVKQEKETNSTKPNGTNVKSVKTTKDVFFILTGNKAWTEYDANGSTKAQYRETRRDAWSVYLTDTKRSTRRIIIDLYQGKVKQNGVDLHTVKSSSIDVQSPSKESGKLPSLRAGNAIDIAPKSPKANRNLKVGKEITLTLTFHFEKKDDDPNNLSISRDIENSMMELENHLQGLGFSLKIMGKGIPYEDVSKFSTNWNHSNYLFGSLPGLIKKTNNENQLNVFLFPTNKPNVLKPPSLAQYIFHQHTPPSNFFILLGEDFLEGGYLSYCIGRWFDLDQVNSPKCNIMLENTNCRNNFTEKQKTTLSRGLGMSILPYLSEVTVSTGGGNPKPPTSAPTVPPGQPAPGGYPYSGSNPQPPQGETGTPMAPVSPQGPDRGTSNNLALNKPARQSGDYEGYAVASRAVDGNINGNFSSNSVSCTAGVRDQWFEIDLQDTYEIEEIVIYNRTDCCHERINGLNIRVSDSQFRSNFNGTSFARGISQFTGSKSIKGNATGRYVRLHLPNSFLQLAEVAIYGKKSNTSPPQSTGLDSDLLGQLVRIQNQDNRINVENGLASARIKDGAWSAQWIINENSKGNYTIENRWKRGSYLYMDGNNGRVFFGKVSPMTESVTWKITKIPNNSDKYRIENVRYPNQAIYPSGSRLKTGNIPISNSNCWWQIK